MIFSAELNWTTRKQKTCIYDKKEDSEWCTDGSNQLFSFDNLSVTLHQQRETQIWCNKLKFRYGGSYWEYKDHNWDDKHSLRKSMLPLFSFHFCMCLCIHIYTHGYISHEKPHGQGMNFAEFSSLFFCKRWRWCRTLAAKRKCWPSLSGCVLTWSSESGPISKVDILDSFSFQDLGLLVHKWFCQTIVWHL